MPDPVTNLVKKCWNGIGFQLRGRPRSPIPVIFCDNFLGSPDQVKDQAIAVRNALRPEFEVVYFSNDLNTAAAGIRHIFDSQAYAAPPEMSVDQIGSQRYGRKAKVIIIGSGCLWQDANTLRQNVDSGFPNGIQVPWLAPNGLDTGAVNGLRHGSGYPLMLMQRVKQVLLFLGRTSWRTRSVDFYKH